MYLGLIDIFGKGNHCCFLAEDREVTWMMVLLRDAVLIRQHIDDDCVRKAVASLWIGSELRAL